MKTRLAHGEPVALPAGSWDDLVDVVVRRRPGEVALGVLIDQGELSILAVYPLEEWMGGASPGERALRYELRRAGGEAIRQTSMVAT